MSISKISMSKATQQQQNKFFIGSLNTMIGQSLVELFRNDSENDINPHIIVGTLSSDEEGQIPRGIKAVIDPSNIILLSRIVMDCDHIIYDITKSPIDEIEFVLKILKFGEFSTQKNFILISSALTWGSTTQKDRRSDSELNKLQESQEYENDYDFKQYSSKYSRLTENDLFLRKCPRRYELWKELELKVISSAKPFLRTYVICSGITYGNGEEVLFNLFRRAWTKPDDQISIIGEGMNILPMIHVNDLAQIIKKTIELQPSQSYIFGVDQAQFCTQRKVIQCIADNIATGLTKHISLQDGVMQIMSESSAQSTIFDQITLNLWLKPTSAFNDTDSDLIDATKIAEQHSLDGFCKNIKNIREEFQKYRGLQTVKLVILGPSFVGKGYNSKILASKYQIPHITISDLLEEAKIQQGDLFDSIRNTLKQIREKMLDEALVIFEQEKKKKKQPKGQPEPEFDQSKIVPRLPDDLLVELYRWRIEQNDAQNNGYILDGFPKTADQAKGLYFKKIIRDDQSQYFERQKHIIPKSFIVIDQSDEGLKESIKSKFSQEEILNSRYSDEQLNKRLLKYRQNIQSVIDVFNELQVQTKQINSKECDSQLIPFVERDGPILVLNQITNLKEEVDLNRQEFILMPDKKEEIKENIEQNQKSIQQANRSTLGRTSSRANEKQEISRFGGKSSKIDESRKFIDDETRNEQLRQQEREILDVRSQPLRQYLADNVVPYITEGLIELCQVMPKNPILFLADFLEAKATEINLTHSAF